MLDGQGVISRVVDKYGTPQMRDIDNLRKIAYTSIEESLVCRFSLTVQGVELAYRMWKQVLYNLTPVTHVQVFSFMNYRSQTHPNHTLSMFWAACEYPPHIIVVLTRMRRWDGMEHIQLALAKKIQWAKNRI